MHKYEDVGSSTVSTATATAQGSGSGSNSTGDGQAQVSPEPAEAARRRRPDTALSSSFKGVVLQQNGHWGAQIYARHSRIWLGTFRSERAAAAAYDSAAAKLHRSGDIGGSSSSHYRRNLPPTELTAHESAFQDLFTTEAIIAMIRDGSYESRFAEFLRIARVPPISDGGGERNDVGINYRELFQKELTPSDVGKLNRLVVPKKHAMHYFPVVSDGADELLLEFRDRQGRSWAFRYCYWKSSQSYVFTKGWNKFVKEKGLRAKDIVTFYRCEEREGLRRTYCMIDVVRYTGNNGGDADLPAQNDDEMVQLELGLGRREKGLEEGEAESCQPVGVETESRKKKRRVRLFGVCIS